MGRAKAGRETGAAGGRGRARAQAAPPAGALFSNMMERLAAAPSGGGLEAGGGAAAESTEAPDSIESYATRLAAEATRRARRGGRADPSYAKAHFRQAQCLVALGREKDAETLEALHRTWRCAPGDAQTDTLLRRLDDRRPGRRPNLSAHTRPPSASTPPDGLLPAIRAWGFARPFPLAGTSCSSSRSCA